MDEAKPVPGTVGWTTPDGRHMQAYQVRCDVCGQDKYPTLDAPPTRYVCAVCRTLSPAQQAFRKTQTTAATTARLAKHRQRRDA
jgi:hypothetical protein